MLAAWEQVPTDEGPELRLRLRIGAGHAGLRARMREGNARTEDLIVAVLTGQGVPRLKAVVVADPVLGALTAALLEWATAADPGSLDTVIVKALSQLALEPVR